MVLFRGHLRQISGEPEVYDEKPHKPLVSRLSPFPDRADNGDASNRHDGSVTATPRASYSSRREGKSKSPPKPNVVSAYDVTLRVRSRNPVADAHNPDIRSSSLPSHHVPTFISLATRAIQKQGTMPGQRRRKKREAAKIAALKAAEAVKSSAATASRPALQRGAGSQRYTHSAAMQKSQSQAALPLLTFKNPWESFQAPTLLSVWRGLKWGLPPGYEEGGESSKYRGKGRHAHRFESEREAEDRELGAGWSDVKVVTPDWGWAQSEKQTWLEGPHVDAERAEEAEAVAECGEPVGPQYGKRKEWQDPRAEQPADYARVSWLGHASLLIQLPPLADPTIKSSEGIEAKEGGTFGGIEEASKDEAEAEHLVAGQTDEADREEGNRTQPERSQTQGGQLAAPQDGRKQVIVKEGPFAHFLALSRKNSAASSTAASSTRRRRNGGLRPRRSNLGDDDGCNFTDDEGDSGNAAARAPQIDNTRDRSINVLFDPCFSKRCSPSKNVGPLRFTEAPCTPDALPPIDVILLSHSHFDHLDVDTLRAILKKRGSAVHVFVGLCNKEWLCSAVGFSRSQVSELDWWDEAILTSSGVPLKPGDTSRDALRIVCTPAQHGSGRAPGDKDSTLWCSWLVEQISPGHAALAGDGKPREDIIGQRRWRAFFAGDTGLRRHGEKVTRRRSPVCPAFQEIARRYGTPHLFLLPISIGSSLSYLRSKDPFPRRYSPFPRVSEALTSCIHMDAEDAAEMMDIMTGFESPADKESRQRSEEDNSADTSKKGDDKGGSGGSKPVPLALAIHFGTFVRNAEQTKADVRNLRAACLRHGIRFARTQQGRFSLTDRDGAAATASTKGKDAGGVMDKSTVTGSSLLQSTLSRAFSRAQHVMPVENSNGDARPNGDAAPETKSEQKKGRGVFLVADQGEAVWIKL